MLRRHDLSVPAPWGTPPAETALLKEIIDAQMSDLRNAIEALNHLTDAKFVTFRTLVDSEAEKVALALTAADKAVTKSETSMEKRFEGVNEFREQLRDQAANLVTRREVETMHDSINLRYDSMEKRITELTRRVDTSEGTRKGVSNSFGALVAAIGAIVVIVNVVLYALHL